MNPILDVSHVLALFPKRKKSWAYRELQAVRDALGKRFVTLKEFAAYLDLDPADLLQRLV